MFVGEYSLKGAPRRMFTEGSLNLSRDLYSNFIGVCNRGCDSCEHYYGDNNCKVKSWIASLRRGVSLRTVGNVLQFYKDKHCGIEDTKLLSENINKFNVSLYHDYFAEEIVSVERCVSDVFDVTVPSTHLFMAKGFVNHNTQATISIIFRNAKKGKKCVYLSLEMPKEQVWMMFQARWLYEVHNLQVTSTDLIQKKLTKEMLAKVKSLEAEYTEEFASNIIVCDSSVLPKGINKSSSVWVLLFKSWERKLKGLDLVAHDHIGQYDRLFPEEGNNIIKMITDATVVYKNKEGAKIVSLFACQCNRDGLKRATKRNGVYDITAISDLNEVERASAYIVFLYTPEDKAISQETVVTLAKHRLGAILSEPTPVAFIPSVSTVGSTVEQISYNDDISSFGDEFGDFGGSGDFTSGDLDL